MCSAWCPLHLLLLDHALADHLVHRGFNEGSADHLVDPGPGAGTQGPGAGARPARDSRTPSQFSAVQRLISWATPIALTAGRAGSFDWNLTLSYAFRGVSRYRQIRRAWSTLSGRSVS